MGWVIGGGEQDDLKLMVEEGSEWRETRVEQRPSMGGMRGRFDVFTQRPTRSLPLE